jgi:tRNA-uridine 2-sulfurtransferase
MTVFRTQSIKKDYQNLIALTNGGEFSLSESCRRCQRLLLSKAARYMERIGADYLVTGSVPGRHGLTAQDMNDMAAMEGLDGRVLRPLAAERPLVSPRCLDDWTREMHPARTVDETTRLTVHLADELGLACSDPAGSESRCKLTAPGFGERVAALLCDDAVTLNALCLLDFPMYFKARPDLQIVLAFDETEKRELQNYFLPQDLRLFPATPHGPMTLLRTNWDNKAESEKRRIIEFVARLTATYAVIGGATTIPVYYRLESEDERQLLHVEPFASIEELGTRDGLERIPLELPAQRMLVA